MTKPQVTILQRITFDMLLASVNLHSFVRDDQKFRQTGNFTFLSAVLGQLHEAALAHKVARVLELLPDVLHVVNMPGWLDANEITGWQRDCLSVSELAQGKQPSQPSPWVKNMMVKQDDSPLNSLCALPRLQSVNELPAPSAKLH